MAGNRINIEYDTCQTRQEYTDAGYSIVENIDGTVSIYDAKLNPTIGHENRACCTALGYNFDSINQKCKWTPGEIQLTNTEVERTSVPVPVPEDSFKIILNPDGSSSTFFGVDDDETASLLISFDYMLNFDCKEILGAVATARVDEEKKLATTSTLYDQCVEERNTSIARYQSLIDLELGYGFPYILQCGDSKSKVEIINDGLVIWEQILGTNVYNQWLASSGTDTNLYDCKQVEQMLTWPSKVPVAKQPTFVGLYDRLESENKIAQYQSEIAIIENEIITICEPLKIPAPIPVPVPVPTGDCVNYVRIFEELEVYFNLERLNTTTGLLETLYQEPIFDIPFNSLSDYIVDNYGKTGLLINGENGDCSTLNTAFAEELLVQYGINHGLTVPGFGDPNQRLIDIDTTNEIPQEIIDIFNDWFRTCWLRYVVRIDDDTPYDSGVGRLVQDLPSVLDLIRNREINISLTIKNDCMDFSVLLDNIKLEKDGSIVTNINTIISEPPSFDIKKVLDNKKSWLANETTENREFDLQYRVTDYNINHHKLVINSKEMDLNLSPASAIETDVCCFSRSNPSIFYFDSELCEVSGVTYDTSTSAIEPIVTQYTSSGYTYQGVTDCQLEFTLANQLPVDTDIYAIFDTTSMSVTDGEAASDALNEWFDSYTASTPSHEGSLYIIPHGTEEWIDYANRLYTGAMPVSTGPWTGITQAPPLLNTGGWVAPTNLVVLAFVDESNPGYHSSKTSDGFNVVVQPTASYLSNLDTFTGTTHPSFTYFKGVVYPIVKNILTHGGALVLQTMAAIEARLLTAPEIVATNTTVDVSLLLTENAYIGLPAMKDYGWKGVYDKTSPASEVFNSESFGEELDVLLLGDVDLTTVLVTPPVADGNINLQSVGCFNINSCVNSNGAYDTSDEAIQSTITEYIASGYVYQGIVDCQLQFQKADELPLDADIYAVYDTTSMSVTDGTDASAALTSWFGDYQTAHPDYTGSLYIIPHRDERWLLYAERIRLGIMDVTAVDGWELIGVIPPAFNTGLWVPPNNLVLLSFCDESCAPNWSWSTDFNYHSCDISDGFGAGVKPGDEAQPTSYYITDYNVFTGSTYPNYDFFRGISYPIPEIGESLGHGEALVLQTLAAIEGTALTQAEIDATNTLADVSPLLSDNPYSGMTALKEYDWYGVYDKTTPASAVFSSESFNSELNELILGVTDGEVILVDAPGVDDNVTCVDFTEKLSTELIDVKNRKTIQSYPTLKSLYERYLNRSTEYSDNQSSQFNYTNTDVFGQTIGNYWVDLIEQVVPSTTLWKSTYEYKNTIYDQQKFRYKKNTTYFCTSNVDPLLIASQTGVTVTTTTLTRTNPNQKTIDTSTTSSCDGVWIKNYDIGSEFMGTIEITGNNRENEKTIYNQSSKTISEDYYYDNL